MTGFGGTSEYGRLSSVLLYRPCPDIGNYPDPARIQHLSPIDHPALMREFDDIVATYETLGIRVNLIDDTPLSSDRWYRYNMLYCRDLLFMTPKGAIMGSMANNTRSAEPLYAARTLQTIGIPVLHTVSGDGTFEGADAIWLRPDLVLLGVGSRTNLSGFEQVANVLSRQGIHCEAVPSLQTRTQHLLGTVQVVDRDLALVRSEITDPGLVSTLESYGIAVAHVPEHAEVVSRQAMNIVTIAPRTIIMTDNCPLTRQLYLDAGLTIAAELELTQVMAGAGGLACATGILARN